MMIESWLQNASWEDCNKQDIRRLKTIPLPGEPEKVPTFENS